MIGSPLGRVISRSLPDERRLTENEQMSAHAPVTLNVSLANKGHIESDERQERNSQRERQLQPEKTHPQCSKTKTQPPYEGTHAGTNGHELFIPYSSALWEGSTISRKRGSRR